MLIVTGILGIIGLIMLLCLRQLYLRSKVQATQIAQLEQQLAGLCTAAVGADERFVAFDKALNTLREQHNTLSLGPQRQQGYEHAIRLARKGVAVEQIIDRCNLSDEEARLISRLHGYSEQDGEFH